MLRYVDACRYFGVQTENEEKNACNTMYVVPTYIDMAALAAYEYTHAHNIILGERHAASIALFKVPPFSM